jgi:L-iditol 2-dehydrogenase
MKGAVYHGPYDIRVEERPKPVAGRDGVVLKVRVCGICPIIDLNMWHTMASHEVGRIIGHEVSGEVVEVGTNVTLVKEGDRIYTFDPYVPCYKCPQCLQGDYWRCENWGQGMSKNNGAFAEYLWIPFITPDSHIKFPDTLSFRDLALIEPMHLSIGLAKKVKRGDTVVIIGQHIIGLALTAQLKKLGVAGKVITSAISKIHCDASAQVGADMVINGVEEDLVRAIMKETNGVGADKVFVCDARPISFVQGFSCARDAGQVMQGTRNLLAVDPHLSARWAGPEASFTPKQPTFGTGVIYFETAWGTLGNRMSMWRGALDLIQSGTITAEKYVTHTFPLEQIDEAFKTAVDFHKSIEVQIEL